MEYVGVKCRGVTFYGRLKIDTSTLKTVKVQSWYGEKISIYSALTKDRVIITFKLYQLFLV